jgi:hypothetical protein
MAAEAGHHQTRSYRSQDGAIHLNGGELFNQNEENMELFGGVVGCSSAGLGTAAIAGPAGFRSVVASVVSSALSSAAGVASEVTVKFASNSSSIDFYFWKATSTAVPQLIAATSTNNQASYMAMGL